MARDHSEHTQRVHGFFDARASFYDAFYEPGTAFQQWFNRVFRKAVYLRRDQVATLAYAYGCKTVLDVGCGSGRNTIWWAHQGIERLHGVDVSGEMIEKAKAFAQQAGVADRCTFEQIDFMNWKSDQKYDMVVACGVFDYAPDAEALLSKMASHANRMIYGSFPGWTMIRSPLRKIRYALRGCPTHFYRRSRIKQLFDRVGFGPPLIKFVPSGHLAWAARLPHHQPGPNG